MVDVHEWRARSDPQARPDARRRPDARPPLLRPRCRPRTRPSTAGSPARSTYRSRPPVAAANATSRVRGGPRALDSLRGARSTPRASRGHVGLACRDARAALSTSSTACAGRSARGIHARDLDLLPIGPEHARTRFGLEPDAREEAMDVEVSPRVVDVGLGVPERRAVLERAVERQPLPASRGPAPPRAPGRTSTSTSLPV